jgi:hypothetical protein
VVRALRRIGRAPFIVEDLDAVRDQHVGLDRDRRAR